MTTAAIIVILVYLIIAAALGLATWVYRAEIDQRRVAVGLVLIAVLWPLALIGLMGHVAWKNLQWRLATSAPADGWRGIATAPKDGTEVRLLFPDGRKAVAVWGYPPGDGESDGACWWSRETHRCVEYASGPTHWAPLVPV